MDRYIQAHGQRLFGLCLTLCAHRQDAEDLYQDTWLKVLRHKAVRDGEQIIQYLIYYPAAEENKVIKSDHKAAFLHTDVTYGLTIFEMLSEN